MNYIPIKIPKMCLLPFKIESTVLNGNSLPVIRNYFVFYFLGVVNIMLVPILVVWVIDPWSRQDIIFYSAPVENMKTDHYFIYITTTYLTEMSSHVYTNLQT
jgi:hypothetical protein